MNLKFTGTGLTSAMLILAAGPAFAEASEAAMAVSQATETAPAPLFIPAEFIPPRSLEAAGFKLVPLGPELVSIDFAAYMSSIEHLQQTFTRSTAWPHKDVSDADAMRDMETEQARFNKRESFAYAVLTPDGSRERGCVYVYPSTVEGYDAVVTMWVTKAEYDAGFDAELYEWTTNWVRTEWPFKKVAYPGRAIDWATWDSALAANTASEAAPEEQNN